MDIEIFTMFLTLAAALITMVIAALACYFAYTTQKVLEETRGVLQDTKAITTEMGETYDLMDETMISISVNMQNLSQEQAGYSDPVHRRWKEKKKKPKPKASK